MRGLASEEISLEGSNNSTFAYSTAMAIVFEEQVFISLVTMELHDANVNNFNVVSKGQEAWGGKQKARNHSYGREKQNTGNSKYSPGARHQYAGLTLQEDVNTFLPHIQTN